MLGVLARRFILRDFRKNPLRTVLTIIGISLGVAIWLAIWLANQSVLGRFEESLGRVAGRTNLQIVSAGQPDFPETALRLVGFGMQATPVITQTAVWPTGTNEVIQVQGADMLADTGFRDYAWAPQGEPTDSLAIFRPNHVFLSETLAKSYRLRRGQAFPLLVNDGVQTFHIAGILSSRGLGGAYGGNTMYMDIGTAQQAFGMAGRISRIDLIVPDTVSNLSNSQAGGRDSAEPSAMSIVQGKGRNALRQAEATLRETLPPGLSVQRPSRNNQQVERMLRAFQTNLTTLSFISLLVSMFLIYNTMSIAVIRRRPEIGTLRALGVSRKTVAALFALEAFGLGLLGSLGGLALGILMAQGAVRAVSLTVETLYLGHPVKDVLLTPSSLLAALSLGIGLTVLAALPSVLEAAGVSPAEAVRRAAYEMRIMRLSVPLALIALLLGGVAVWASFQPAVDQLPLFGYLSALLTIVSVSLLLPWLLQRLLPFLALCMQRLGGVEGRLASMFLYGALGRTSVAVASLTVGVAMMVSLAVMIGSFRQTVQTWVNQTLKADLWIEPASRSSSHQTGRMSPAVIASIERVPGVEAIDPFLEFPIDVKGEPANVGVGRMEVLAKRGYLQFLGGQDSQRQVTAVLHSKTPAGLITESFSLRHHVRDGDVIRLKTPRGPLDVTVRGIYYDYSSEQGYLILDRSLYTRYYGEGGATNMAVFLAKGADPQAVRQAIYKAIGPTIRLTMRTNQELRAEVLRIFDSTFAITYALHAIAIIVAILGITNTLFALTIESRREFGILKYLGSGTGQIQKIVLWQAGLLGLLSNILGLLVGLLLAMLLIFVINRQSFGWTIQWSLPTPFLIQSFFLLMATALISGAIPARIASKTLAPEVVRAE